MRPKVERAIDSEAIRARGIIVLVKSNQLVKNNENKKNQLVFNQTLILFGPQKACAFLYQWAIIYSLVSSSNQKAALIIDHQLDFTNMYYPASGGSLLQQIRCCFFFDDFKGPENRSSLGQNVQQRVILQCPIKALTGMNVPHKISFLFNKQSNISYQNDISQKTMRLGVLS